ncbi:TonB-dependent receptor plug domain-containing protein [Sphingomonas mucosissima]|uniref:TonB-dependent receptor plug domain-containing protein n=1 Tax=Sphingomonas mucosissima TaxID=370959 RepID=UPI0031842046
MRRIELFGATAMALVALLPGVAVAQATPEPAIAEGAQPGQGSGAPQGAGSDASSSDYGTDIVVTAQRQAQTLQAVPIAVSAFSAAALEAQQIDNASDLQLTLPNVTFSKGNFSGASFTIRGIGDLCVGISCDAATAIHLNGSPLLATRIFETEYFDLERVEVCAGRRARCSAARRRRASSTSSAPSRAPISLPLRARRNTAISIRSAPRR